MSKPDQDLSSEHSSIDVSSSESNLSNLDIGSESRSHASSASSAKIESESIDRNAADQMHSLNDRSRAHEDEMERLKERLREQDARLEATTRLLSTIRIADPAASNPVSKPTPISHFIILGGAGVLLMVAAFLYMRAQAGHSVDQPQTMALTQTQPAVGLPATAPPVQPQGQSSPAAPVALASPPPTGSSQPQLPPKKAPAALAKAAPLPLPDAQQGPPPDETPRPEFSRAEKPAVDTGMSHNLTDYLHHHRLPYVDATVYAKAGSLRSVSLFGEVRTAKGREDAEIRSHDFLGLQSLKVRNSVRINPELASNAQGSGSGDVGTAMETSGPAAAANSCTDLCQKDDGHCEVHCRNQSVGNATGLGGGISSVLGGITQTGTAASDCIEDCHQTSEHCTAACSSGGSEQQSNGSPAGAGSGEQGPSGPDQPPG